MAFREYKCPLPATRVPEATTPFFLKERSMTAYGTSNETSRAVMDRPYKSGGAAMRKADQAMDQFIQVERFGKILGKSRGKSF